MIAHGVHAMCLVHADNRHVTHFRGALFDRTDVNDHSGCRATDFVHADGPGTVFGHDPAGVAHLSTGFDVETSFGQDDFHGLAD